MNRVCTKCNIEKPLSEFHKKKNGLHGVNSRCKLCVSIIDSNRWINILDELREKRKEQSREYYRSGKRKKQIRTKEQEKIKKKKQRENIEYKLRDNLRERVRKYIKRKNIPVDNKRGVIFIKYE